MSLSSSRRESLFAALTVGGVILLFAAVLEVSVRVFVDDGMQFDLEMWKYARQVKQTAENPRLGHEHRPSTSAHLMGVDVVTNSRKLRDDPVAIEKPPGVQRILMLGDSFTFGWGVAIENTVSHRLEATFERDGARVEVINAGVGHYNTVMEVEYFLTEGRTFDPDVVVLNYFINDAEPVPAYGAAGMLARSSFAYVYLRGRLDVLFRQLAARRDWAGYYLGLYADGAPGWVAVERSIDALAEYCRRNGIVLMIVAYPELRDLKNYRFTVVHERLADVARRHGAVYVDLLDAVRGIEESRLWVTRPDPHPNALAHGKFADALYPKLGDVISAHDAK